MLDTAILCTVTKTNMTSWTCKPERERLSRCLSLSLSLIQRNMIYNTHTASLFHFLQWTSSLQEARQSRNWIEFEWNEIWVVVSLVVVVVTGSVTCSGVTLSMTRNLLCSTQLNRASWHTHTHTCLMCRPVMAVPFNIKHARVKGLPPIWMICTYCLDTFSSSRIEFVM